MDTRIKFLDTKLTIDKIIPHTTTSAILSIRNDYTIIAPKDQTADTRIQDTEYDNKNLFYKQVPNDDNESTCKNFIV